MEFEEVINKRITTLKYKKQNVKEKDIENKKVGLKEN